MRRPQMAGLLDFDIRRVTPDQIRTIKDAEKLVAVFHAATKDRIYEQFRSYIATCFKDIVDFNSGAFQVARLRNDAEDRIIGVAYMNLRFAGSRDPEWEFVATERQTELHSGFFSSSRDRARPIVREFTGDPVLTRFVECLEARGQRLTEKDEDILIIEPIHILPQYQHIEGLAKALLAPVLDRAVARNLKVVAYNHRHRHDYSHPTLLAPEFRPLYPDIRVVVHVDTKETPEWTGDELTWEYEFQWFTIGNRQFSKRLVPVESE